MLLLSGKISFYKVTKEINQIQVLHIGNCASIHPAHCSDALPQSLVQISERTDLVRPADRALVEPIRPRKTSRRNFCRRHQVPALARFERTGSLKNRRIYFPLRDRH